MIYPSSRINPQISGKFRPRGKSGAEQSMFFDYLSGAQRGKKIVRKVFLIFTTNFVRGYILQDSFFIRPHFTEMHCL